MRVELRERMTVEIVSKIFSEQKIHDVIKLNIFLSQKTARRNDAEVIKMKFDVRLKLVVKGVLLLQLIFC
jgi:hypothetical protein